MATFERATADDLVTVCTEEYGDVVLRAELDPEWGGLQWQPAVPIDPTKSREEIQKMNAGLHLSTKK